MLSHNSLFISFLFMSVSLSRSASLSLPGWDQFFAYHPQVAFAVTTWSMWERYITPSCRLLWPQQQLPLPSYKSHIKYVELLLNKMFKLHFILPTNISCEVVQLNVWDKCCLPRAEEHFLTSASRKHNLHTFCIGFVVIFAWSTIQSH